MLRGVLRKGTILENNINQTVSSAITNAAAGVIFTFPALLLMGDVVFNPWAIGAAAIAGAFLGTLFIIPLRKQMIELERLRFPWGVAVAEVLRSPGAGAGLGVLVGLSMYLPIHYTLPYGLGCLLAMASDKWLGRSRRVEWGLPVAAGLLVGDSLSGVVYALVQLARSVGGGS